MSVEKKRDKAQQQRVRDRQSKTGESYQTAWRHVAGAMGADTITADPHRRWPLSLSTDIKILPGQFAQITGRPQLALFCPDRLLIKHADRWDINALYVGAWRKGGLLEDVPEGKSLNAAAFALDTWSPLTRRDVLCGEEIVLVVTYVGPDKDGESFEAVLFGWEGRIPKEGRAAKTSVASVDASDRIEQRAESREISFKDRISLPLIVTAPTLFAARLTIQDAHDWVVNDVLVRGRSIFVQAGDLPGEMFSEAARVILEPLAAEDRVEIVATYRGKDTIARLVFELSGTAKQPLASQASSYFLPMSANLSIEPTQTAQITARPQQTFLPERMIVADPDDWIINDIKIGVRSQSAATGDMPAQAFSSRAVGSHISFDPVLVGQDFILVTSREACKEAAPFFCGVRGRLVSARDA